MEYKEIRTEINKKIVELAELIEKFCVIDNKEYTQLYKDSLRDLHRKLEEFNNN